MKRLKIALVCDWFLPRIGGIEHNMRDLAKNLIAQGHEVHVITACPGPDVVEGIRVHRLDVRTLPLIQICYGPSTLTKLKKVLLAEKFDLLHTHYLLSTLSHSAIHLAHQLKIPTVFTHHSINGPLHHPLILKSLPFVGWLLGVLFFRMHYRGRLQRPNVISAVSRAVAEDLAYVYDTDDIEILPNGIDPQKWRVPHLPTERFTLTCVMRLCKSKQPLKLIQAMARIKEQLGPQELPFLEIIGDGSQRHKMVQLIERFGLQKHIRLMGRCSRNEIKTAFSRSQLFVMPSTREGFGIAVLEARTAGLPVVAMNHGGVGDIITDGEDGFLMNSYEDFADKIAQIIRDRQLHQRITAQAREPLVRLSWDNVISRHLKVYQQALAQFPQTLPTRDQDDESLPDRRFGT